MASDPNSSERSCRVDPATDSQPMEQQVVGDVVRMFKLLSDETRLRILHGLLQTGELNVRALCERLGQSQPAVSHHLALLRKAQLIDLRRDGKHNFYFIVSDRMSQLRQLIGDLSLPGLPAPTAPSDTVSTPHLSRL